MVDYVSTKQLSNKIFLSFLPMAKLIFLNTMICEKSLLKTNLQKLASAINPDYREQR
jgi:hypothetical protein